MNKIKINEIFEILSAKNPEPKTELKYINEYTMLVAVALSAQATDVSVNKATEFLFKKVDNPYKMVKLGEEGLTKYIKSIGLYRGKAKNVIALSQMLIEKHNGIVPNNFDKLIELPGVGRKTASVVMNCVFKKPTIAVDTHVFRVANRTGMVKTKTADETQAKLEKIVPEKWRMHAHHWLILHGRYICVARKPKCYICPIVDLCKFKYKNFVPPKEASL